MTTQQKVLQNYDKDSAKKIVEECEDSNSLVDEGLQGMYHSIARCICSLDVTFDSFLNCANNDLDPSVKLDGNTLERYCLKIYEEEKAKIQKIVEGFDGQICISVDVLKNPEYYDLSGGRSDKMRFGCYMCVRVHFVDENWKLRKWVLQYDLLEPLWPRHIILKCFQEFDIVNKISVFMVHDTFGEIVTYEDDEPEIVDILNSKIPGKEMPKINGSIFRVPCCASLFCVMAEEAFEEIDEIISKMRELYSFGNSFPTWHVKLQNIEMTLEMKSMGEYDSDEEWKRASDACRLVGYIQEAAEVFYEAKNAAASLYLYNLQKLRAALIKESVSSDELISKMALHMLEKLNKYWKDAFMILAFATVLDPRCKLEYIKFVLLKYEGDAGDSQFQRVRDAFDSLFNEYIRMYPLADFQEVDSSSSDANSEEEYDSDADKEDDNDLTEKEKQKRDNPAFGFDSLDEYNHFVQCNSKPHRSELELYLEEPVWPWNRINLLSYWRTASNKYPTLGRMAKDILAIPLSLSNDFDAYFTDFRPADRGVRSLKPHLRNPLMCTRNWFQTKASNLGSE